MDPQSMRAVQASTTEKILFGLLAMVVAFDFLLFPLPILAQAPAPDLIPATIAKAEESKLEFKNSLPKAEERKVVRTTYHTLTAYNSEAAQCWGDPCITANGFNLCEHGIEDSVAANFLPFGTKIKIPELFGDRIFIVRDRMNARYRSRIDIWMLEKQDAKQFGVKVAKVEILE
jgi:3D (Asp-Asp-Asp) domain-containing protein